MCRPLDPGPCLDGGGSAEHVWILLDGKVQCRDCPEVVAPARLYEVFTEYSRIVESGLAILQGELDQHREDLKAARGELMVPVDEMPPGSTCRRLLVANRLISREREEARAKTWALLNQLRGLQVMIEDGAPAHALSAQVEAALESAK